MPALYQLVALKSGREGQQHSSWPAVAPVSRYRRGQTRHLSRVGLGTSRIRASGRQPNERTTENLTELMVIGDKEYLYKAF